MVPMVVDGSAWQRSDVGLRQRPGVPRQAALASLAMALVLFMVGGWGVHRTPRTHGSLSQPTGVGAGTGSGDAAAQARDDGVDVGQVTDTVRHRMVADPSGALVSEDERYRASFDAEGFEMAPAGESSRALRVSTTGVARGSTTVDITAGQWLGDANVAERSLAPGVTERVTATTGQVEWDVVLASRPAGQGDLRIDARVTGASARPERVDGGLAWAVGAQQVVMGELVVRDRTGTELHRAVPEAGGAGVRLTVPSSVLDDAAYPVTVDPRIGPEQPVSVPVTTPSFGSQSIGAVAFDGTNYLVVWTDRRAGFGFTNENVDVYGARVGRSGEVLDTTGIQIATGPGEQSGPDVAFDGTNYLVTWDGGHFAPSDLHGTFVGRDGSIVGPSFPIATGELAQNGSAVSYDGTNYLVVWQQSADLNFQADVYGARVSREGVVLDPGGFRIAGDGLGLLLGPDVSFDGTNHFVVWGDVDGISGARVSRTGAVLDAAGIAISPRGRNASWPSLAFDGTNHLVVWSDFGAPSVEVYGARVSREGLVLDPDGIRISPEVGDQIISSVAFDGTNYLVAFEDNRDGEASISGARVGRNGVVRDPSSFPIDFGDGSMEAIAFDGTNYLVVWTARQGENDVQAARVSRAGAVRDGVAIAVSTAANAQTAPAIVFDGTNHLVVWEDHRSGTADIYAGRVGRDGTLLDGAGILLGTGPQEQRSPAVAYDGRNYLVVWQERLLTSTSIVRALVSTDGAVVVGATPVFTRDSQSDPDPDPDVAFDGTNFLVVWELNGIRGTRVDRGGTNLDPSGILIAAGGGGLDPAVAFDGTNHLVVWNASDSIAGKRVSPAGRVVDATPLEIGPGSNPPLNRTPALAFDGTNYLVVWQENDTANRQSIVGRQVNPAGEVLGPTAIRLPPVPGNSSDPDIAFNGTFLVVWQDRRPRATGHDVYGTRVRRNGTVVDAEAFPISSHANDEFSPAVAAGPDGHWGVVSHRFVDEAPYRSHRVLLRDVAPK